mgnify:CR=1 FL=1
MTLTASDPPPSEIYSPDFIASFLRGQTNLKHFLVVWRDGRQIVFQIQPDPDVMTGVLREADERMAIDHAGGRHAVSGASPPMRAEKRWVAGSRSLADST